MIYALLTAYPVQGRGELEPIPADGPEVEGQLAQVAIL